MSKQVATNQSVIAEEVLCEYLADLPADAAHLLVDMHKCASHVASGDNDIAVTALAVIMLDYWTEPTDPHRELADELRRNVLGRAHCYEHVVTHTDVPDDLAGLET